MIHSEPADELEALLNFARHIAFQEKKKPVFVVCSSMGTEVHADVHPVKLFPAYGLFSRMEQVITASGFNLMQQAADYQHKHRCMPFTRRFDDQFLRFQQWKAGA